MGEPIAEMEFGLSNAETLDALKPDIKKNDEKREADLLKQNSGKNCDFSAPENAVEENIFGNTSKESNAPQMNETKAAGNMSKNDEISSSDKKFPASFFKI
uniref:Uncharacterized protein n=1 Tax=Panagrolaimus sp. ES5 TaxID=591445 RepID=A0AC34GV77_9BILA